MDKFNNLAKLDYRDVIDVSSPRYPQWSMWVNFFRSAGTLDPLGFSPYDVIAGPVAKDTAGGVPGGTIWVPHPDFRGLPQYAFKTWAAVTTFETVGVVPVFEYYLA